VGLRNLVSTNRWLHKIIDFRDAQIFSSATNYTCIFHLIKEKQSHYHYTKFEGFNVAILDALNKAPAITEKNSTLTKENWIFIDPWKRNVFKKLNVFGKPLLEFSREIFVGLQTSSDPVYILKRSNEGYYSKYLSEYVDLEDQFMYPLLKGNEIKRYKIDFQDLYIIFPYEVKNEKAELIPESKLKSDSPKLWKYLKQCEDKLRGRENGKMDRDEWYGYVYPKNLAEFDNPKIMTQVLASKASMVLDEKGDFRFVGGGNAGGYGIVLKEDAGISSHCLLGLLNSKLLDTYLQSHSTVFRGGFYSYSKRYLKDIPIRIPASGAQQKLEELTRNILSKKQNNQDTKTEEQQIDLMVYHLYELTYDEVLVIDPEPPFSRAEYENAAIHVAG